MRISGFTIARNVIKYNYPFVESVRSILPICDEFIINVGDSEDETLRLIESLREPKIRIIHSRWDFSQGKEVLSLQTNLALQQCRGDWGFYLQGDEVIHEEDLPKIKRCMLRYLSDENVDALRFRWFHFYGSYYRYRIDRGWYQKQDRIIRLNGKVRSCGDAYCFERTDGQPLRQKNTGAFLYHYGWVHSGKMMTERRVNAEQIGFTHLDNEERDQVYDYGDLNRFPVYFGTHPKVMDACIRQHVLSTEDWEDIRRRFWWHPFFWTRVRYKTFKRIPYRIE